MLDVMEGKGPIYMRTEEALQKIADQYKDDKKAYTKKMKELESEAWEDFLDMTISQAILWAATNVQPEEKTSEIAAAEPYFIGSHSGASGAWVSGPKDLAPPEYFWGYENMSTVKGLFCAGDASGASSHKFSSGSHAEGRIAAKSAIRYIVKEKPGLPTVSDQTAKQYKDMILKPLKLYEESQPKSTQAERQPQLHRARPVLMRLQKLMDEYAGGVSSQFTTSRPLLERALELLELLKEDSASSSAPRTCTSSCAAGRTTTACTRPRPTSARSSSARRRAGRATTSAPTSPRWTRSWLCFVNCTMDPKTEEWKLKKVPIKYLFA